MKNKYVEKIQNTNKSVIETLKLIKPSWNILT